MSQENKNVSTGGISFFGLLGIVFIVLKLLNVIQWSWWIVLMPFWIPSVLVIIILLVVMLIAIANS